MLAQCAGQIVTTPALPRVCRTRSRPPSSSAVVRRLNELYKASVVSCGLSLRLQRFFLDKQRLLDRVHSITAERLIFSHAVQMVRDRETPVGQMVRDRQTPVGQGPGTSRLAVCTGRGP